MSKFVIFFEPFEVEAKDREEAYQLGRGLLDGYPPDDEENSYQNADGEIWYSPVEISKIDSD